MKKTEKKNTCLHLIANRYKSVFSPTGKEVSGNFIGKDGLSIY